MEIELSRDEGTLVAKLRTNRGKWEPFDFSSFQSLGSDLDRLLKPLLAELRLKMLSTARQKLRCLAQFGEALQACGCRSLPTSGEEWQALILDVHHFIHTREDRKQSLVTRHINIWKATRRWFVILIDEGIASPNVHLPSVHDDMVLGDCPDQLLGESSTQSVDTNTDIDKLLMPISLSRTDAAYLDEVRDTLTARRQALFSCLKDYWEKLRENLLFGLRLRRSLTDEQIAHFTVITAEGRRCVNEPGASLESLAAYLTVLEKDHGSTYRPPSTLGLTPYQKNIRQVPKDWPIYALLPANIGDTSPVSLYTLTWTWLGRLSQRDVAVIVALLIMLHPKWTPAALTEALVHDRAGKSYLDLDDESLCFEVKKHRAKAMKREMLTPLSEEVLTTILSFSSALREQLKLEGNPLAGRLFLPWGRGGGLSASAPMATLVKFITGREKSAHPVRWLGHFYPSLLNAGLTPGTISFKKIRATEGVLEWFRTKSLQATSKRLGNTKRVVLEHYIPKALVRAWMTRAARRFQNLWIAVAVADEPFILDVSDFSSIEDLNAFVAGLLQSNSPSSSPLAAELHRRFGAPPSGAIDDGNGVLHVSLNVLSLSALYSYHAAAAAAAASSEFLTKVDLVSGTTPNAFIQLADLLQLQLPIDRNVEYRRLHEAAMASASDTTRVKAWAQLFS